MGVDDHRQRAPKSVNYAVLTVSDTRALSDDRSGEAIAEMLGSAGHRLVRRILVKDDVNEIRKALREMVEEKAVEAVIINGGTGISRRDVTLEAVAPFQEKALPGFGEIFRMLSFSEIGSAAIMSRAAAFVTEGKVVFCLPGSEKAVRLAASKLIAQELGHLIWEANR